jgi:DnaK suppressor protein
MANKTFLKQMKEILLAQKQDLLDKLKQKLDIDADGDDTDEIQANISIGMNNSLNIRNAAKLKQIKEALERIEDSTYGICQSCDEEILEKRLLHNPYFLICVACAEEIESEEKQRKRL